jgi:hypothetical protein
MTWMMSRTYTITGNRTRSNEVREIGDYSRDELLELVRIKDKIIAGLNEELEIYMDLCRELSAKCIKDNDTDKT